MKGKITDGVEALPFVTVWVKGTSYGTTCNSNGIYQLKLEKGNYEIEFQYLGYSRKSISIVMISNHTLDVILKLEPLSLKEVVIMAGEDPAYPIIRRAIKKRKFYLKQPESYSCETYIKGMQKIKSLPKNIKGLMKLFGGDVKDTLKLKGILYLSESQSKYFFRQPNKEKEIMFASKVSGENKAFSYNKLSDLKFDFYNNLLDMKGLSDRPFVSPINDNAFLYYRYVLLGKTEGEKYAINKIKVLPKRETDPCFSGIIYIQDSTWQITGIDLNITRQRKINYVDTLTFKQLYASVDKENHWMPISKNLSFTFKAFGFIGSGYINASIKNYSLQTPVKKKEFNGEKLKVEEGANKKDNTYWMTTRPVPLTLEETIDYKKKDSIEVLENTPRYMDSVDKKYNKYKFANLLTGYSFSNTKKKYHIYFPGVIANGIQYNTIEGVNLSYKFGVRKEFEKNKEFSVDGRARYGFSNFLWGGHLVMDYRYNPVKFASIGLEGKSIIEQFNRQEPISPLVNSIYTLFLNENFLKGFKESGGAVYHSSELANGIFLLARARYMQRDPLLNHSDRLVIDDRKKVFTSNDPLHPFSDDSSFASNRAFTIEFNFTFRIKQEYYTLPDEKVITRNKFPVITVNYKRAIPILNSSADYDLLSATVSDVVRLGLLGRFRFRITGGKFLETNKLFLPDYKFFLGNQTIFNSKDYLNSFRLLPYYTYSANQWFAEAHGEQHFRGFIINKIPFIKKLDVQEVAGFHFLSNNNLKYYYEINFGLEKLFKIIRVDYVLGYGISKKVNQGITIGFTMQF